MCFICSALSGGPLIFIIMTCVGNNPTIVMALMVTAATCFIFIFIGFNINHLDLTPNFAGVLMGICNGFEMITTTISPTTVGFMVSDPVSIFLLNLIALSLSFQRISETALKTLKLMHLLLQVYTHFRKVNLFCCPCISY